MCAPDNTKAANNAAMKQYEHQLAVRKRNWMDQLSLANVERVQYDQTLDAIHVGLGNAYAALQDADVDSYLQDILKEPMPTCDCQE